MKNSFYSAEEVKSLGFRSVGENVFISRFASFYDAEEMEIGDHVRIDDFCILSGEIKLGNFIHISAHTSLYARHGIEMEDYTGLSPKCVIFSATDDFSGEYMIGPLIDPKYTNLIAGRVLIKRYSQLGSNCIVLPRITIGEGVAVGAMSLITANLEPWMIYGGVPAKFIKERSRGMLRFGL
jgi:galactoside O-acetyltransferase